VLPLAPSLQLNCDRQTKFAALYRVAQQSSLGIHGLSSYIRHVPRIELYGILNKNARLSKAEATLQIEFEAIRRGGQWEKNGVAQGLGMLQHKLNAHKLLWPEDHQHRWFILGMKSMCENKVSVFLGPASSNKTYLFAVDALIDFWARPYTSFGLISSTEKRSLEIKVWGRVKELFNRGRRRFDDLAGFILESAMAITPDETDDDNEVARELNRGIVCVPCVSGGRFVGMGKFQGAKPPHTPGKNDGILKHYGDEAAVMQPSFLDAYANWMVNDGFRGVMGGNPTDISDPLCVAAEPKGGWDSFVDTAKTQEWTSRWYDAHVVSFDGRDTPNNDEPKNSFPYLITQRFIDLMKKTHGENSWQYFQQAVGKPSKNMVSNRVITIGLCEENGAFKDVVWLGPPRTTIYIVDPAYGGGDRCVGGTMEFGMNTENEMTLSLDEPEIIPIRLDSPTSPEDQIAQWMFTRHQQLGIPPDQMAYDSFGRGTLGFALAKEFGANCPIPIDSGAQTTDRPVRFDLYVDEKNGAKRLKTCKEHYSKFITEMWFSVRETIISGQLRNLPMEVAQEGQLRLFKIVKGNKVEVESKDDMKERIHKSPDLFDWLAIGLELARRLGFRIERIGREAQGADPKDEEWFDKEANEWNDAIKSGLLKH
jgi:hypothetical protein